MSRTESSSLLTVETDEGTTVSRSEIYRELLDMYLLAPLRVMWSDWRMRVGILIIVFFILMGTVGVVVVPRPTASQGPRYLGAFQNMQFPLGTNNLGESLFSQIVHATPAMLKMIIGGAVFSTVMATLVGTLSGYKGGTVDTVLMYVTDVAMTIPGLPLILLLVAIWQPKSPFTVGIILTINAWAGLARAIRSQVLTLRNYSYVEASRVMGVPISEIIRDDILPNIMPYVLVNFVNSARGVIFGSVALYFIGVLPATQENWGLMMRRAYSTGGALYTWRTAHWLIEPMVAVVMLSFGLILVAQGTERLFNPRIRARHAKTTEGPATGGEGETETEGMEDVTTW